MSRAISPTPAEVESHILRARAQWPGRVAVEAVATTPGGRPLYAVTLTDPDADPDDQQHVLVVAGQHGNEESARGVALALIDWLGGEESPEAAEVRRRQRVVILPDANPDGAEADTYENAAGVQLNADHAPGGPVAPEAAALERVAYDLRPEVFLDLHARGFAGCSYDMVLYPWTRDYTVDQQIHQAMAGAMAAAGEAATSPDGRAVGIPHVVHPLTWAGWGGDTGGLENARAAAFAYRQFKSIALLSENCESNEIAYPAAERAAVGLAKARAMLAWGGRRHPGLHHAGYPNSLVTGQFTLGVAAVGRDAARRRASRVAIWNQVGSFEVRPDLPEWPDRRRLRVRYGGAPLRERVGFQVRLRGRQRVEAVSVSGAPLPPAGEGGGDAPAGTPRGEASGNWSGFLSWHDACSTYVLAALPELTAGEWEIDYRLRSLG